MAGELPQTRLATVSKTSAMKLLRPFSVQESTNSVTTALLTTPRYAKNAAILLRVSCDDCPMMGSDFIALFPFQGVQYWWLRFLDYSELQLLLAPYPLMQRQSAQ